MTSKISELLESLTVCNQLPCKQPTSPECTDATSTSQATVPPIHNSTVSGCVPHCTNSGTWCPHGLHEAKVAITTALPLVFARNRTFGHLFGQEYPDFTSDDQCMRYFLQYMPLHTPQIGNALNETFAKYGAHFGQTVRIIDIGGGPATLLTALAGLIGRPTSVGASLNNFEVTEIEPSPGFAKFVDPVVRNLRVPRVRLNSLLSCRMEDAIHNHADVVAAADWIVLANVLTPLVQQHTMGAAVSLVRRTIELALTGKRPVVVTIIENGTGGVELVSFMDALASRCGRDMQDQFRWNGSVSAPHLAKCRFYVTRREPLTQPRLRFGSLLLQQSQKG